MTSSDHGGMIRRGAQTTNITPIGTYTTSTGLPPESTGTSYISESFVKDGHDMQAAVQDLRTTDISSPPPAYSVSYYSWSTVPGGNDQSPVIPLQSSPSAFNVGDSQPGYTVPVVTKYYKMVGYYVTGAVFESFVVSGSPAASTCSNPNTGHTLTNTFVSATWSQ